MHQQGSPCCGRLKWLPESKDSKVNPVGPLDVEKLAAAVLLYLLWIGFPKWGEQSVNVSASKLWIGAG